MIRGGSGRQLGVAFGAASRPRASPGRSCGVRFRAIHVGRAIHGRGACLSRRRRPVRRRRRRGERRGHFSDSLRELFATSAALGRFGAGGARRRATAERRTTPGARRDPRTPATLAAHGRSLAAIDDAQRRLQRLWSDALREAAAAFTARLVAAARRPHMSAESMRKLYDSWIDCAEDAYARIAHSEPFCSRPRRIHECEQPLAPGTQASMEYIAKLLDLPTRSEINSLMQRLKAVERVQLRAAAEGTRHKPPTAPGEARQAGCAPQGKNMSAAAASLHRRGRRRSDHSAPPAARRRKPCGSRAR